MLTLTWEEILALVFATMLGGAIGLEREVNGKPAGLRTNIIVCLGATAFTLVAIRMGLQDPDDSDILGRVVQGIVTGVGFLGAGALIQEGSGVHGLTTAASIWLVASIGVACGAGFFLMATVVTFLALVALFGLLPLTRKIRQHRRTRGDGGQ